MNAFRQHRAEPDARDDVGDLAPRAPIGVGEERQHLDDELVGIRPDAVRKIEHRLATLLRGTAAARSRSRVRSRPAGAPRSTRAASSCRRRWGRSGPAPRRVAPTRSTSAIAGWPAYRLVSEKTSSTGALSASIVGCMASAPVLEGCAAARPRRASREASALGACRLVERRAQALGELDRVVVRPEVHEDDPRLLGRACGCGSPSPRCRSPAACAARPGPPCRSARSRR